MKKAAAAAAAILLLLASLVSCAPAKTPPADRASYYYSELEPGKELLVDIDGDGLDDTVLFNCTDSAFELNITRASDKDHPFTASIKEKFSDTAVIVCDCDPNDSRREVIVSCNTEYLTPITVAYRVDPAGEKIENKYLYSRFAGLGNGGYFKEGRIAMEIVTQVLGTNIVTADYTVTENGFELVSDTHVFKDAKQIKVVSKLPVTVLDKNGDPAGETTVAPGTFVTPIDTDLVSVVRVSLSTGGEALIRFTLPTGAEIPLIGENAQDDYLEVSYDLGVH